MPSCCSSRSLILLVFVLRVFPFPVGQDDGSGMDCKCPCPEEPTTTSPAPTAALAPAQACGSQTPNRVDAAAAAVKPAQQEYLEEPARFPEEGVICPDGWSRYQDSCYYMESAKMGLIEAERACNEKGATLFIADSIEEFNEVMKETPPYFWSWIGLGQSETDSYPRWQVVLPDGPSPMSAPSRPEGHHLAEMVDPAVRVDANGWSSAATCAAYYNMKSISGSYLYFYPCSSLYHSVCERNTTLSNLY
ncbi:lectin C-type domain protein [Ostertagia ostertagi]